MFRYFACTRMAIQPTDDVFCMPVNSFQYSSIIHVKVNFHTVYDWIGTSSITNRCYNYVYMYVKNDLIYGTNNTVYIFCRL